MHKWNNISIKHTIVSLKTIFETSSREGQFPGTWKKIVVPLQKEEDENLLKNYTPVCF